MIQYNHFSSDAPKPLYTDSLTQFSNIHRVLSLGLSLQQLTCIILLVELLVYLQQNLGLVFLYKQEMTLE